MMQKFETKIKDGSLSRVIDAGMAKLKLEQGKKEKEQREKRRIEREKKVAEKSNTN